MRLALFVVVFAAACGKGSSAPPQEKTKTSDPVAVGKDAAVAAPVKNEKRKRSPATPICKAARARLGYDAACVETELPELTTPAGKVVRVHDAHDPTMAHVFALVRPSGEIVIGSGSGQTSGGLIDEITKELDLAATPPETLARLIATLYIEDTLVRCLPGTNDVLPEGAPCHPPEYVDADGKKMIRIVLEQFPSPAGFNRDRHELNDVRYEIENGRVSSVDGNGLASLDPAAPRPDSVPPVPGMTVPPEHVAPPVTAPADVNDALCALARERVSGMEGQRCEVYAYPSLDLPTGSLYYLANDAGLRNLYGLRKPDGTYVTGYDLETTENPLNAIVAHYDPAVVPPEKFLAAYLLLAGEPMRIRCLPGANDVLPDGHPCTPPTARMDGADLVIDVIVEDLPLVDQHGNPQDPAIRDGLWHFTPNGGMSRDGHRLVDLRDDEP
jgi:hypothetical protein